MVRFFCPFRVLSLPYNNEEFRMLIILPNRDFTVKDMNLEAFNLANLEQRLVFGQTLIQMPRFKAKLRTSLEQQLMELGVETLFNPNKVNLTDISEEESLAGECMKKDCILYVCCPL